MKVTFLLLILFLLLLTKTDQALAEIKVIESPTPTLNKILLPAGSPLPQKPLLPTGTPRPIKPLLSPIPAPVKVQSGILLEVNESGKLVAETDSIKKELVKNPEEITGLAKNQGLDEVTELNLNESAGEFKYVVNGNKIEKLLLVFRVSLPTALTFSDSGKLEKSIKIAVEKGFATKIEGDNGKISALLDKNGNDARNIAEFGIGNGISMLIFAGIMARIPVTFG